MASLRARLVHPAAIWLSLHVTIMAGAPAVSLLAPSGPSDIVCTCVHDAGHGACPMHRTKTDDSRCRLESPASDFAAVVVWAHGLFAPVLDGTDAELRYSAGPSPGTFDVPADRTLPPEAPPPRA